jgi:hypothetical protein
MGKKMDGEEILQKKKIYAKVNLKMTFKMVMVNIFLLMEIYSKANTKMEKKWSWKIYLC